MINKLISGYLKEIVSKPDSIPNDIEISCINFFGTYGIDGDLIIEENTTHRLNKKSLYQFSSILIKEGATLTAKHSKQIINILLFYHPKYSDCVNSADDLGLLLLFKPEQHKIFLNAALQRLFNNTYKIGFNAELL